MGVNIWEIVYGKRKASFLQQARTLSKYLNTDAEYNDEYGQIELTPESDEDAERWRKLLGKVGYKVKRVDYYETGGYNTIAQKPGLAPVVILET